MMRLHKRKSMAGFTLVELLLVLAITSFALGGVMRQVIVQTQVAKAEIAGVHLKQFTVAVRQIIANEGAAVAGGPGLTQNYTGHEWLQSAVTCGAPATASADYLPCSFRGVEPFGLTYSTDVTHNNVTGTIEAVITFDDGGASSGSIEIAGTNRLDLANTVATTATRNDTLRASATGAAGYDAYDVDAGGVIIATASLTSDLDLYIRRDGGNSPTAAIDWGGQDLLNVNNAGAVNVTATTVTASGDMHASDYEIVGKTVSGGSQWASESISDVRLLSSGQTIPKPVCPSGTPQVFAYPVIFSRNSPAEAIGAVQAWATDSGTFWTIRIRVLTPSGWHGAASAYRRVVATSKCVR